MADRSIQFFHPLTFAMALVAGVMLLIFIVVKPSHKLPENQVFSTYQGTDAPLSGQADASAPEGVHLLSAWDLARVPEATRFDWPLGALSQISRGFGESKGKFHLGIDMVGVQPTNEPVYAVADGLVVANVTTEEGRLVILAHRLTNGELQQSAYQPLDKIEVAVGMLIGRGTKIGSIATQDKTSGQLHFEIRRGSEIDAAPCFSTTGRNRVDPAKFLASHRGAAMSQPTPAMLDEALFRSQPWNQLKLSPSDAAKLGELLTPQDQQPDK